jgi:hypothetical protein
MEWPFEGNVPVVNDEEIVRLALFSQFESLKCVWPAPRNLIHSL